MMMSSKLSKLNEEDPILKKYATKDIDSLLLKYAPEMVDFPLWKYAPRMYSPVREDSFMNAPVDEDVAKEDSGYSIRTYVVTYPEYIDYSIYCSQEAVKGRKRTSSEDSDDVDSKRAKIEESLPEEGDSTEAFSIQHFYSLLSSK
uniref:Dimer_Tnp_hAT domain-containing protein n=1 Tax=Steinernema glaseri TaxID=37863 RepID=A0A1I7Y324_9BILA